jgi:UDP-N-acetylglucosamine 2-epimerase (non-hydrolysing)
LKILHVVGARPNYMKIAPILREINKFPEEFTQVLVHTGQHYDASMSQVFFDELDLPRPDMNLEVGSGSHAWQTAQVMLRFEPIVLEIQPDWVIVVGDVNSTVACALVCTKLGVRVAHVEAGLRSFDRSMPEEINRVLTDQIADLLFTPSEDAGQNLAKEGLSPRKIHFVGNVMIDTLVQLLPKAQTKWPILRDRFGLDQFILVTLHRDFNVDDMKVLKVFISTLEEIAVEIPVLFPVHPRTRSQITNFKEPPSSKGLYLLEPLGYLDFLALEAHASLVLTDSGGIQEETTFMGVPCLTARPNTERPITITQGTNRLVPVERNALTAAIRSGLTNKISTKKVPPLWDGRAAERIISVIKDS